MKIKNPQKGDLWIAKIYGSEFVCRILETDENRDPYVVRGEGQLCLIKPYEITEDGLCEIRDLSNNGITWTSYSNLIKKWCCAKFLRGDNIK